MAPLVVTSADGRSAASHHGSKTMRAKMNLRNRSKGRGCLLKDLGCPTTQPIAPCGKWPSSGVSGEAVVFAKQSENDAPSERCDRSGGVAQASPGAATSQRPAASAAVISAGATGRLNR